MSEKQESKSTNIVWHNATITRELREKQNRHKGAVLWFTGLSGSGKSTLAHAVEDRLYHMGSRTFVLDGDNVRHGLCSDLGFSDADRTENIRRIGELAKLFLESGSVVLTAFISPFQADREIARNVTPHGDFYEIFCDASLDVCEERDVKGCTPRRVPARFPTSPGSPHPTKRRSLPNWWSIPVSRAWKSVLTR